MLRSLSGAPSSPDTVTVTAPSPLAPAAAEALGCFRSTTTAPSRPATSSPRAPSCITLLRGRPDGLTMVGNDSRLSATGAMLEPLGGGGGELGRATGAVSGLTA